LPVTRYTLYVRKVGDAMWKVYDASTGGLLDEGGRGLIEPECSLKGLDPPARYEARVSARNIAGWSGHGPESAIVVLGLPQQPQPPSLRRESPSSMLLSWEPSVCHPPAIEYCVRMRELGEREWKEYDHKTSRLVQGKNEATLIKAPARFCIVQDLHERSSYEVMLEVRNEMGWGPPSESSTLKRRRQFDDDSPSTPAKEARTSDVGMKVAASLPQCSYFQHCKAFMHTMPNQVQAFIDFEKNCMCYCETCHKERGDKDTYSRGGKKYALPLGWVRFALHAGGVQAEALGAFHWHCAFHGTHPDALSLILGTGRLLKPGDATAALGGQSVSIRPGHIQQPFWRDNLHTGKKEHFNPVQIFCSPSIRYCELPQYAKKVKHTGSDNTPKMAQVAFQLRLRPGTYAVGQETVKATTKIDPNFENTEIEWYTDGTEHASHVLTGLLVKLCPA